VRAARRAHAGGGARQFAARVDHGFGELSPKEILARELATGGAGDLPVECDATVASSSIWR